MQDDIYSLAFDWFAPVVRKYELYFLRLKEDLKKARIDVAAEKWAALVFLVGVLSFICALILGLPLALLLGGFNLTSMLFLFLTTIVVAVSAGALTFFYPSLVAGERKKKITNAISFATIYLSTLSRSGFPPQDMFKLLSTFKEYGEISTEAAGITRDVEAMGMDLPTALTRAINRSPSPEWGELLAGIRTTVVVGGDISLYLAEKAKGFIADYKRRLTDFSNLLSLLVEVYITIVIVGAVFFIVISSIMVAIGGVPVATVKALNYALVLVGLPLLTAAFILVVKGLSPLED